MTLLVSRCGFSERCRLNKRAGALLVVEASGMAWYFTDLACWGWILAYILLSYLS